MRFEPAMLLVACAAATPEPSEAAEKNADARIFAGCLSNGVQNEVNSSTSPCKHCSLHQ
jgi:hypothetical protein